MVTVVFVIEDTDGERYPVTLYSSVNSAVTLAELRDDLLEPLWNLIRPLITGILVDYYVTYNLRDNIVNLTNNVVDLLSDIQEKAKFSWFVESVNGARFVFTLPTVREVIFTNSGSGKLVDITDSDVQALITAITTHALPAFWGVDSHDFSLTTLDKAYQWFGKR